MIAQATGGPLDRPVERRGAVTEQDRDAIAALRAVEFARLDASGETYLDYTGSALPFASHVRAHTELLRDGVFGNPHSGSGPSRASTAWIEAARSAILSFLGADPTEYAVVFTANASAAAKLVGESFRFSRRSRLVLSADNHNSVLGLREYARARGARVAYIPLDAELRLHDVEPALVAGRVAAPSLLAFPAQSNFSGVRHPLALVRLAQAAGYDVLLDAAAYVPSRVLRLDVVRPEFVTLSLYKVLGYPTGVGALVARRSALARLRRPWFAGGTIEFASVQNDVHLLKHGAEGFEDGTPNFLAASAVATGLPLLERVGRERIGAHVEGLTAVLLQALSALGHANGRPLVRLYGPPDLRDRGGTLSFNLYDHHGRPVPHEAVEAAAAEERVAVRSGCFCNPGAAERALGFEAGQAAACVGASRVRVGPVGFSLAAFGRCMDGVPVGAVRASLGVANVERDVDRLIAVLERWRR